MIKEVKNGALYIDGCNTNKLAKQYGTPLYIMSESAIIERFSELRDSFLNKYPNVRVAYASKAFCTLAMCKLCQREGIGIDVASGGELYTAMEAGFPPEMIEFNGNNKLRYEIEMAVDYGIGRIIVDGQKELSMIEEICREKAKKMNILFRITPGVEANSHEYIITGKVDSKFGMPQDETIIFPQIKKAINSQYLDFLGLHFHIGSQIREKEAYLAAIDVMLEYVIKIKETFHYDISELNLGGGFAATYTDEERKPYSYYLDPAMEKIDSFFAGNGVKRPAVVIEPGRSVVAEAGLSLYTIGSIKEIKGIRKYLSVDGGMTDNLRPALYNAVYSGVVANRASEPKTEVVTIAGKCCESGDILIKDIKVAENVEPGDLFAVFTTGAYGYSMASNYNRNPVPPVVLVKEGRSELIVKRQSFMHMISNDMVPEHLK